MREGALVVVGLAVSEYPVDRDVPFNPSQTHIMKSSHGIVLSSVSNRHGNLIGYNVWVAETGKIDFFDEYWIKPLT